MSSSPAAARPSSSARRLIGAKCGAVRGDVMEAADLDRSFAAVRAGTGRVDVLVTSAGLSEPASIDDITEAHHDRTFDLNARGMVFTVQRAVPLMPAGPAIVLIGSIGTPGYGTYGATKAAVRAYARTRTRGTGRPRHPREHAEPGADRYPDVRGRRRRDAPVAHRPDPAAPSRPARRGGGRRPVPRLRRQRLHRRRRAPHRRRHRDEDRSSA